MISPAFDGRCRVICHRMATVTTHRASPTEGNKGRSVPASSKVETRTAGLPEVSDFQVWQMIRTVTSRFARVIHALNRRPAKRIFPMSDGNGSRDCKSDLSERRTGWYAAQTNAGAGACTICATQGQEQNERDSGLASIGD
jgi:hypothetical protein